MKRLFRALRNKLTLLAHVVPLTPWDIDRWVRGFVRRAALNLGPARARQIAQVGLSSKIVQTVDAPGQCDREK